MNPNLFSSKLYREKEREGKSTEAPVPHLPRPPPAVPPPYASCSGEARSGSGAARRPGRGAAAGGRPTPRMAGRVVEAEAIKSRFLFWPLLISRVFLPEQVAAALLRRRSGGHGFGLSLKAGAVGVVVGWPGGVANWRCMAMWGVACEWTALPLPPNCFMLAPPFFSPSPLHFIDHVAQFICSCFSSRFPMLN